MYFTINNNWVLPVGPIKEKTYDDDRNCWRTGGKIQILQAIVRHKKHSVMKSYEQLIISPAAESYHLSVCVFGNNSN